MCRDNKLEESIRNLRYPPDGNAAGRILQNVLQTWDTIPQQKPDAPRPSIWRQIMKTKILRYAAAAAVIIAIGTAALTLNHAQPAYAVEQTIEAMRSITSFHAFLTDWDGSQGEIWVQYNPETGNEEYYCADQENFKIVGTPQATYYYDKVKNSVRIRNQYAPASDVRFTHLFEDLVNRINEYHGELSFYSQFDENLYQEVIVVHGSFPTQGDIKEKEFIVRVDPQTKLPINIETIKCAPGQGVKSADRIEYNVAVPEGIFEFNIPEGAQVVTQKD
jgi:hypothetical protein